MKDFQQDLRLAASYWNEKFNFSLDLGIFDEKPLHLCFPNYKSIDIVLHRSKLPDCIVLNALHD